LDKPYCSAPVTGPSGTVVKHRDVAGFTLTENVYAAGCMLPWHRHAHAYLNFVQAGTYKERYTHRECTCSAGDLRYLPSDEPHECHYETTVRLLLVRIDPAAIDRLGDNASMLSHPGDVGGIASSWLANRLYREFQASDDIAPLAMEGVLLEILAESARVIGEGGAHAPLWLRRVREALEDSYLQAPSLAELASIGGIHPVHLSREFRKHYDTTIGEYIRKRRIEHACHLLANTTTSLSEIALVCGFSDQSHFCAMFKSHTGLTPAKFRDMSGRP